VGLWDTVDAYGGPIEEMTRAIDYWVWPLSMPDRFMSAKVHKACHALALEDERDAFRPVIWDERYVRVTDRIAGQAKDNWLVGINHDPRSDAAKKQDPAPHLRKDLPAIDQRRISQVWFTGVHSDIGGGYPQDGLSYVTFDWMLDRAKAYGLRYFDEQRELLIDPQINPSDKLNDSRKGLAGYYRYKPRNVLETYSAPPYKPSFIGDVRQLSRLIINDFRRWRGMTPNPDPQVSNPVHQIMLVINGIHLLENLKLPEYRTRYRTQRELRGRKPDEVLATMGDFVRDLRALGFAVAEFSCLTHWGPTGLNSARLSHGEVLTAGEFSGKSSPLFSRPSSRSQDRLPSLKTQFLWNETLSSLGSRGVTDRRPPPARRVSPSRGWRDELPRLPETGMLAFTQRKPGFQAPSPQPRSDRGRGARGLSWWRRWVG
jgi:hypothetical protein